MSHFFKKDNLGYTVTEIIVGLVIMGSLIAVTIPNYFRIRRQTNMELAKQNLRVIGEEMNEIYNQNKQFPASLEEIENGASPQEISITESLNAIKKRNYVLTYGPNSERNNYTQRIEPLAGMEGLAGSKCFILDPMGVRELSCWSGEGVKVEIWGYPYLDFAHLIQFVLNDSALTGVQKATILAGMIEYFTSQAARNLNGKLNYDQSPGYAFPIFESVKDTFDAVFPKVYDILKNKGVRIYGTFQSEPSLLQSGHLEIPAHAGEYHIGARMADRIKDFEQDREFQTFYDYVQKVCFRDNSCNGNLDSWNSQALILSS